MSSSFAARSASPIEHLVEIPHPVEEQHVGYCPLSDRYCCIMGVCGVGASSFIGAIVANWLREAERRIGGVLKNEFCIRLIQGSKK
jgi:hypothetical protein